MVKIALSHVSKINTFFYFTQKFKMAAKMAQKQFLGKCADDCVSSGGKKIH